MTARKPPPSRGRAGKPPAKRAATARGKAHGARGPRKAVREVSKGDRPYVIGLLALVLVLLSMAWSPLRSLAAGDRRLDELTASRDLLADDVQRLEDRKEQLMDPQELEIIAREELGLVKPGEIPYVVVTPEGDPRLRGEDNQAEVADKPWYARVWSAVSRLWQD